MFELEPDKPDLDEDLLLHYGVKGMRWGHRQAQDSGGSSRGGIRGRLAARKGPDVSGVTRAEMRTHRRAANKQLRRDLEDWDEETVGKNRNEQIKEARRNRKAVERKYQDIRDDVRAQRKAGTLGRNAAKIALDKAGAERYQTVYKAEQATTGEAMLKVAMAMLGSGPITHLR